MLNIDAQGMVSGNSKIKARRFSSIERSEMNKVSGIIVHQTGSPTENSTFNSYRSANANGAHFLIGKEGSIYQTASILRRTNHVGPLKARCLAELRCSPAEIAQYKKASPTTMHKAEMTKVVPGRYPSNADSIGIEIVGMASLPPGIKMPAGLSTEQQRAFLGNNAVYEALTNHQQVALQYLIDALSETLHISKAEVHRHPEVSRKNATEAATATWQ
ncbi:N-acetylmuramoyl-L-alanine amidase [Acidovorax sp. SUPP1855]|uniref:peptidoglycan recognition protein family protein n=1 Tax=Acidovorax sp. SUPP1855 TaxID=431774 RepID=UPI0023DE576C|nr:N-acetylmuramoyl-L-alanine amidase [Acidovorax sp. SUPP1855]GKS82777.1 N-acetylmuramoyl-L-alanine amidase [Acidovorax sp. SUPP1855]